MRKEEEYIGTRVMGMGVGRKKETRKTKEEVGGLLYGAETWAVRKAQDNKLDTVEMRLLRWMFGFTRMDRVRNDRIRELTKVAELSKKVQERRLNGLGMS